MRVAGYAIGIAAGENVSYAIDADRRIWAWGYNGEGRLGTESANILEPFVIPIEGIANFKSLSGGFSGSPVALRTDGTVWAWGRNFEGQIGDGTFAERNTPALVLDTTGDRGLDLDPATPNAIPQAKLPPLLALTSRFGDLSQMTLSVNLKPGLIGTNGMVTFQGFSAACVPCNVYVATLLPDGSFYMENEGREWVVPQQEQIDNGTFPIFLRGVQVSTEHQLKIDILQQRHINAVPVGASILVGYGSNGKEMLSARRYYPIFTMPR